MTATMNARVSPLLNASGVPVEPAPYFHEWDETPHAMFTIAVTQVNLGDVVLGGTHQVDGFGRAEQRGTEAIRLDLNYLVGPSLESTARLILPVDQMLEVKRYYPDGPRLAWVKEAPDPAGLIRDYGSERSLCDHAETMCDSCVGEWETDYEVVRY